MFPKITQPLFKLTIPSTGKEVRFRQFSVAEEKILMVAQASVNDKNNPEPMAIIDAFKQLITNCCVDDINVDSLASFDVEWFFLQLRAKSVGNVITLSIGEPSFDVDGKELKLPVAFVNLDNVKIRNLDLKKKKFIISEEQGIGVEMRYPSFNDFTLFDATNPIAMYKMIENCVVAIFDVDNVYPVSDAEPNELTNWLDKTTDEQYSLLRNFINDLPYMATDLVYKDADGKEQTVEIKGLNSFFG